MRKRTIKSSASALLLLCASVASAKHGGIHEHLEALHKRHRSNRQVFSRSTIADGENGVEIRSIQGTTALNASLEKRQGQCVFPFDAGLVAVTPGSQNGGWAMSPNQPCTPGSYCPYACPPGQVSMQWDPSATSYSYPKSMVSIGYLYLHLSTDCHPEWWVVLRLEWKYPETISQQAILPIDQQQHWRSEQCWKRCLLLPDCSSRKRSHVDPNLHYWLCESCCAGSQLLV